MPPLLEQKGGGSRRSSGVGTMEVSDVDAGLGMLGKDSYFYSRPDIVGRWRRLWQCWHARPHHVAGGPG